MVTGLGETTDPTELVPGSVAELNAAIASWRVRASEADDTAAGVRRVAAPEEWEGTAAATYEQKIAVVARGWVRLSQAIASAPLVVQEYASTLRWAQEQAERAIERWRREEAVATVDGAAHAEAAAILAHARERLAGAGARAAAALAEATAAPFERSDAWREVGAAVLTPADALTFLSGVSASELDSAMALSPAIAGLVAQAGPAAVHTWWDALRAGQRRVLTASFPSLVANLEGVDYSSRDTANRALLDGRLERARAALAQAEKPLEWWQTGSTDTVVARERRIDEARDALAVLASLEAALTTEPGGAERMLVSLTADEPPFAAIAVGDPDAADNVTYTVPGMGSSAAGMGEWARSAENLRIAQSVVDPGATHAVIAWVGYEAPPVPMREGGFDVLLSDHADAGAEKLDVALSGFAATRADASLNVVAHSYGTTTSAIALSETTVRVDAFVSLGSAGLPVHIDDAADLNADHVYAGQARNVLPLVGGDGDQWAWTGRAAGEHPVDPVHPSFGAHAFGSDTGHGGLDPVVDHGTSTSDGGGYLDRGTESLRNVAFATTGQGALMSPYDGWSG